MNQVPLRIAALAAAVAFFPAPCLAETAVPLDQPYLGALTLSVDLRDAARKIFRVHETIPAQPGALTLYYPKWIPGEHSPSGPITGVTGLKITAKGLRVAWRRDLENMYVLHPEVPEGASALDLDFEFLSPTEGGQFGQSVSATPRLVDLEWNQVLFYPAGYYARRITVEPSVALPEEWGFGTALETAKQSGGEIRFEAVTLNDLVDSPLIAGRYFKRLDLAPGAKVPVHLDLVADRAENLEVSDAQLKAHRALVRQAIALFGAQHYKHYDFLLTLSGNTGHFGLEHHQSSDDRSDADFFTDPDAYLAGAGLLPHEYVHSWNGKFRRPADLWTPNFNLPMKDDLLWVYEGLTQYLGQVLTARAGLRSPPQYRDALAATAASMSQRPGRAWRPLQDTADEAQILYYAPPAWLNWRRSVDFYPEGELLWLDVDTRIRELSRGRRSLDDFARAFFGINDGSVATVAYGFDDIVKTLNQVQPYDWAGFLRRRLDATDPQAPLDGVARAGWKLVYTDQPSDYFKASEKQREHVDLMASLGIDIEADKHHRKDGELRDVLWNSPAFEAGLAPGMKNVAVNGEQYSPDILKDAIKAAQGGNRPIELLVQNLDYYVTVKVDYRGGLKYPHLVRTKSAPDRLSDIVRPR